MGLDGDRVIATANAEEAIDYLRRHLATGDNVLVKGARQLGLESIVAALRLEG
jgi:UDP-N-acetylmuramyl pentapeptide synthase